MKKLLLLFLSLPVIATAQIVNIPDANFKAYLVGNTNINTNGDGEIQVSEATAFTGTINVFGYGISDLTGIEAFTALTYLDCRTNSLTSLDVSNNTALTSLSCYNNSLTSLDVAGATALTYISCGNNSLTSLDVSSNTALIYLWCDSNSLISLDVRNGNNSNMSAFSAKGNPPLYCISVDNATWANANWSSKKDVTASFSNDCTVGIEDNELNQPSITSYRNTIQIKGKGTATIFNLQGQRVHHSKLTGKHNISLDKGIYLVRVSASGGGRSVTKKVYLNN